MERHAKSFRSKSFESKQKEFNASEHFTFENVEELGKDSVRVYPCLFDDDNALMFESYTIQQSYKNYIGLDKEDDNHSLFNFFKTIRHVLWKCFEDEDTEDKIDYVWEAVPKYQAYMSFAMQDKLLTFYPDMLCMMSRELSSENRLKERLMKSWSNGMTLELFMKKGAVGILGVFLMLPALFPAIGDILWEATKNAIKSLADTFSAEAKRAISTSVIFDYEAPAIEPPADANWWDMITNGCQGIIDGGMEVRPRQLKPRRMPPQRQWLMHLPIA